MTSTITESDLKGDKSSLQTALEKFITGGNKYVIVDKYTDGKRTDGKSEILKSGFETTVSALHENMTNFAKALGGGNAEKGFDAMVKIMNETGELPSISDLPTILSKLKTMDGGKEILQNMINNEGQVREAISGFTFNSIKDSPVALKAAEFAQALFAAGRVKIPGEKDKFYQGQEATTNIVSVLKLAETNPQALETGFQIINRLAKGDKVDFESLPKDAKTHAKTVLGVLDTDQDNIIDKYSALRQAAIQEFIKDEYLSNLPESVANALKVLGANLKQGELIDGYDPKEIKARIADDRILDDPTHKELAMDQYFDSGIDLAFRIAEEAAKSSREK